MFQPQRVLISKDEPANREQVGPGVITEEPHVGESLQLFLETGKIMRTSTVTHVERDDSGIVVDTQNSRYRLKYAA